MLRLLFVACVSVLMQAQARQLGIMDLQTLVDQLGDEILTHPGLNPAADAAGNGAQGSHNLHENEDMEPEMGKDDDEDVPHPIKVHNWGSDLNVGQVAGIAVNPNDEPVIFHRGSVVWGPK